MVIVLLRHADKLYDNNRARVKRLDPPLKEGEFERCSNLLKIYIQNYQNIKATTILTSPFLRCRETAKILKQEFKEADIKVVSELSEFLGFQKNISAKDFDYETYRNHPHGVDRNENLRSFENRAVNFMNDLLAKDKKEEVTWVVTHGIFISYFLRNNFIASDKIKNFRGIIINEDQITFF